ncbi:hypothetical protein [Methyloceanibacter sp.]|uniref:hypothetical protein n=1 Tax=Methyloceanibacter sp. TaxID=1965321 RepID=UPI00351B5CB8
MFITTDGAVDPTAAHDFARREQLARLEYDIVRMELDQRLEDLIAQRVKQWLQPPKTKTKILIEIPRGREAA